MKRTGVLLALILLALILLARGNAWAGYYGYFWSQDSLDSVKTHSNVAFVNHNWSSSDVATQASKDVATINSAYSKGMRSIVEVSNIAFHVTNHHYLRTDWQARWSDYWSRLSSAGVLSKIVAIIVVDEPDNGKGFTWQQFSDVSWLVGWYAHNNGIKMMLTMAPASVWDYQVVAVFDWIGIDVYGCWDSCPQAEYASVPDLVYTLHNRYPGMKMVMVPETRVYDWPPQEWEQEQLGERAWQWYDLCVTRLGSACAGMFPFLWKSVPEGNGWNIGMDEMPILLSEYMYFVGWATQWYLP